jgi:hypothetical protein
MFEPGLRDGKAGGDAPICRLPLDYTNEGGWRGNEIKVRFVAIFWLLRHLVPRGMK